MHAISHTKVGPVLLQMPEVIYVKTFVLEGALLEGGKLGVTYFQFEISLRIILLPNFTLFYTVS